MDEAGLKDEGANIVRLIKRILASVTLRRSASQKHRVTEIKRPCKESELVERDQENCRRIKSKGKINFALQINRGKKDPTIEEDKNSSISDCKLENPRDRKLSAEKIVREKK